MWLKQKLQIEKIISIDEGNPTSLNNLNLSLITFKEKQSHKYMYQYCKLLRVIKIHDS